MSERVFIIGAGNVGRGLARAFRASGVEVVALHGHKPSDVATSSGEIPDSIREANVVIVAVREPQIAGVISNLAGVAEPGMRAWPAATSRSESGPLLARGTVVLHTSGIAEARTLDILRKEGFSCGTFHPLAPFSLPERSPDLMRGGWIGIDGDDGARATGRRLAAHLGARTLDIPAGGKTAYHAAAVMASNFPVALAAAASDLMHEAGIPERSAQRAVESLMRAAIENLAEHTPSEVLTGPVVRGDAETVRKHLEALRGRPDLLAIYRDLSEVALRLARARGINAKALAEIERLLTDEQKKHRV